MLAAPVPRRTESQAAPPHEPSGELTPPPAAQDNAPPAAAAEAAPAPSPKPAPPPSESPQVAAAPLFRARADLGKANASPVPAVIPIIRPPDDPGIDEEEPSDEFAEQIGSPKAQAGGWRGFLSRWGG